MFREFHLFAGAGGGILGGKLNGGQCVGASEIDKYCRAVLRKRMGDEMLPKFPVYGDIKTLNASLLVGRFDVLCGGFPCQPFSTAASGKNIQQKNLWPYMLKFAIDSKAPIVFAENVSEKAIARASQDLQAVGFRTEAILLSAACLRACHRRNRYWLLAYANNESELLMRIYDEVARLPKLRQGIWSALPNESGVDDELAYRMDRFKATGNGQIPVVAAVAFRVLLKRLVENLPAT